MSWDRVIFHVDMDAYYASIEQRDDPKIRGLPVVVGGTGMRGVVSTASYEARVFGIRSAMPIMEARRRCPDAVFLPGRMSVYVDVSRQLRAIFDGYSPRVEPLSLDEAFLDMTGTELLFGAPEKTARRLQEEIRDTLHLTASVGVAAMKYVAKVASDFEKPAGITVVAPGTERRFLAPLSVERLWGVGPKTAPRLFALGLKTIGDVQRESPDKLVRELGDLGRHIGALAHARDPRTVENHVGRKSVGSERTYDKDVQGRAVVKDRLIPLVDEVTSTLRKEGLRAGGVRLKVKYADFTAVSRQTKLSEPSNDATTFLLALERIMPRVDLDQPIRLIGVAATDFSEDEGARQQDLFDPGRGKRDVLNETVDHVRQRFGDLAIRRASSKKEAPKNPR